MTTAQHALEPTAFINLPFVAGLERRQVQAGTEPRRSHGAAVPEKQP